MMKRQNGYVLIEVLVSLAVFSVLALTVADVAREVVHPAERSSITDMESLLQRLEQNPEQALRRHDLRQIERRTFPNGDLWVTYRYRSENGSGSRRISVLRPAEQDAQ